MTTYGMRKEKDSVIYSMIFGGDGKLPEGAVPISREEFVKAVNDEYNKERENEEASRLEALSKESLKNKL